MTQTLPQRGEVLAEFTWDANSVFPSDSAWEAEYEAVTAEMAGLEKFRGRVAESPQMLADWLGILDDIDTRIGKLHVYGLLFHTVDTTDQPASALFTRGMALSAKLRAASAFGEPEILALG